MERFVNKLIYFTHNALSDRHQCRCSSAGVMCEEIDVMTTRRSALFVFSVDVLSDIRVSQAAKRCGNLSLTQPEQ